MQLKKHKKYLAAAALVAASYSFLPSQAGKWKFYTDGGERTKTIYLTFDDGPSTEYTESLLDLLDEYQIKAAFFVVAEAAEQNPDLIRRMQQEGHLIGLHSLRHESAMVQTPCQTRRDLCESIEILKRLGVTPIYYRPPWGHVNLATLRLIRRLRLKKVLWHVMVQDWKEDTSREEIQYKLLKRTGRGDIICLHDGRGSDGAPGRMLAALADTIPVWLEEGWQFKRLDERKGGFV